METHTDESEMSLPQILYALILALIPFIESILAEAAREGRPQSKALRSLAKTLGGLRATAALFGMKAPAPNSSARKRHPTPPSVRTQIRDTIRRAMRAAAMPAKTAVPPQTRHPRLTPPPWRLLEA